MFEIRFSAGAEEDLAKLRRFDLGRILDGIEQQLSYEPLAPSRNRKLLVDLSPTWPAVPPVWELRLGNFRVFYDADSDAKVVFVRAVRLKPPHLGTEDIL